MNLLVRLSIGVLVAAPAAAVPPASYSIPRQGSCVAQGAHDFDFLYGTWTVQNRRLVARLARSRQWVRFEAHDSFHVLPGCLGSQESYRTDYWPDFHAIGLHLYSPESGQWTLYWADNRSSEGKLQELAHGAFAQGVGTFYAADTFNGAPIRVRIIWRSFTARQARWEQAFSSDGGKSWETNWIMDFTRP